MEKRIYLAGPEVFLPNAQEVLRVNKEKCKNHGFTAVSPLDGRLRDEVGLMRARQIFHENCRLIDSCEYMIANCNPFRGATIDDGTAFEIGYAFSRSKKIVGYVEFKRPLPDIVQSRIPTLAHESGYRIDMEGYLLNEDFGNTINLMPEFAIIESGGRIVEGGLEEALQVLYEIIKF